MGYKHLLYMALISLPLFAVATMPEVSLSQSSLTSYVANREKIDPSEVRQITFETKSQNAEIIALQSRVGCGQGICSSYIFLKGTGKSFDFAGIIYGEILEFRPAKNRKFSEILTQSRSAGESSKKMIWTYKSDSRSYELE